jgi:hypothetical protein
MSAVSFVLRFGLAILVAFWPAMCACAGACTMDHGIARAASQEPEHGCCGSSDTQDDDSRGEPCTCGNASQAPLEMGSAPVPPPAAVVLFVPYDAQAVLCAALARGCRSIVCPAERAPPPARLALARVLRL